MKYYVIKLYRFMGVEEKVVEKELAELSEFAKKWIERNRESELIIVNVARRNKSEGMLIVGFEDGGYEKINYLVDYIRSNFKTLTISEARELNGFSSNSLLEAIVNFLRGEGQ
ncbi:hypothetical protein ACSU1N_02820 [Thermogladius sp. 4427co]|uniref:hypothetical protein n=1 Tax=Thermogladius sp. 4427co TaxID=3450718 RepID=UPI003F79B62B